MIRHLSAVNNPLHPATLFEDSAMRKDSTAGTETKVKALTVAQNSAVDLLVAGKNDTETAAALGLHRVTVTRWRLYSPEFQAALSERRAALWGGFADKLRALLPKAIERADEALDSPDAPTRTAAAFNILKLAGPLPLVADEPVSADEIVRRKVEAERDHMRSSGDYLADTFYYQLPAFDSHLENMQARLDWLADDSGDESQDTESDSDGEAQQ
jgi:hypothetical protein